MAGRTHVYRNSTATKVQHTRRVHTCILCHTEVDNTTGALGMVKVGKKYKKGPVHYSCA